MTYESLLAYDLSLTKAFNAGIFKFNVYEVLNLESRNSETVFEENLTLFLNNLINRKDIYKAYLFLECIFEKRINIDFLDKNSNKSLKSNLVTFYYLEFKRFFSEVKLGTLESIYQDDIQLFDIKNTEILYLNEFYKILNTHEYLKNTSFFDARAYYYSFVIINYQKPFSGHIPSSIYPNVNLCFNLGLLNEYYDYVGTSKNDIQDFDEKKIAARIFYSEPHFGKYKNQGKTWEVLIDEDPNYVIWLILNSYYFSLRYELLDKLLRKNIYKDPSKLIIICTIKNEIQNSLSNLFEDIDDFEFWGSDPDPYGELERSFYDDAALDFLTGGDYDEDNFEGDWDKLDDEYGR
jgi:hypothetical protein